MEVDPGIHEPEGGEGELRELRRAYHNSIAELRAKTISIVDNAGRATEHATGVLVNPDAEAGNKIAVLVSETSAQVAEVDGEVLRLLALQAPVARDLRMILASLEFGKIVVL